jgi:Cu-processing system permease protein
LIAASALLTAIFVAAAAATAAGSVGRSRTRALAVALVVWFIAVILFDIAALGFASFLPSGRVSRLLMISVIANPVDAIRTAGLLATSGTTAFGAASLAFLRFTRGAMGAAIALSASILFWIVLPSWMASRRLRARDF